MSEDLCEDTELEEYDVKLNLSLFTNDEIDNLIETSQIDFSNDINKIYSLADFKQGHRNAV